MIRALTLLPLRKYYFFLPLFKRFYLRILLWYSLYLTFVSCICRRQLDHWTNPCPLVCLPTSLKQLAIRNTPMPPSLVPPGWEIITSTQTILPWIRKAVPIAQDHPPLGSSRITAENSLRVCQSCLTLPRTLNGINCQFICTLSSFRYRQADENFQGCSISLPLLWRTRPGKELTGSSLKVLVRVPITIASVSRVHPLLIVSLILVKSLLIQPSLFVVSSKRSGEGRIITTYASSSTATSTSR